MLVIIQHVGNDEIVFVLIEKNQKLATKTRRHKEKHTKNNFNSMMSFPHVSIGNLYHIIKDD